MEYRVGKCTACGVRYKVPATFQGDRAKCQKCEDGVVEVGPVVREHKTAQTPLPDPEFSPLPPEPPAETQRPPVVHAMPPPRRPPDAPLRPAASAPPPRPSTPPPVPASPPRASETRSTAGRGGGPGELEGFEAYPVKPKRREGPSMKEKLLAARKAAESREASATPAGKPGARAKRRSAATAAAASSSGATPRSSRRSARPARGSSRRSREGDDAAAGTERSGRGRRGKATTAGRRKWSPAMVAGMLVILGLIGFGVYKLAFEGDGDEVVQAGGGAATPTPTETDAAAGAELTDETTGEADPVEPAAADAAPQDAPEAQDGLPPVDGDGAAADAEPAPAEPAVDPASVDLDALAEFGRTPETSPEEWAQIGEHVATFLDPAAGAAGNRARIALESFDKKAVPALLNRMTGLDVSEEQGMRNGDIAQRLLMTICNGTNFGWHHTTEPNDVYFNKRVIEAWWKVWNQAKDDEALWREFAKLDETPVEKEPESELDEEALDELDELEDF